MFLSHNRYTVVIFINGSWLRGFVWKVIDFELSKEQRAPITLITSSEHRILLLITNIFVNALILESTIVVRLKIWHRR